MEGILKQEDEDMEEAGHGGLGLGASAGLGSTEADDDEAGPAGLGSQAGLGSMAGLGAASGLSFTRASDSQPPAQVINPVLASGLAGSVSLLAAPVTNAQLRTHLLFLFLSR